MKTLTKFWRWLRWNYSDGPGTRKGDDEAYFRAAHPYVPPHERQPQTECKSPEGITTGLIDGIISQARVLRRMDTSTPAVQAALQDLRTDADVAWLMSQQNSQVQPPEERGLAGTPG